MYAFAIPVDFEFSTEKVLKLAFETAAGVTSLYRRTTGELLNAWHSDLFTHAFTSILSSQLAYAGSRRWHGRSSTN